MNELDRVRRTLSTVDAEFPLSDPRFAAFTEAEDGTTRGVLVSLPTPKPAPTRRILVSVAAVTVLGLVGGGLALAAGGDDEQVTPIAEATTPTDPAGPATPTEDPTTPAHGSGSGGAVLASMQSSVQKAVADDSIVKVVMPDLTWYTTVDLSQGRQIGSNGFSTSWDNQYDESGKAIVSTDIMVWAPAGIYTTDDWVALGVAIDKTEPIDSNPTDFISALLAGVEDTTNLEVVGTETVDGRAMSRVRLTGDGGMFYDDVEQVEWLVDDETGLPAREYVTAADETGTVTTKESSFEWMDRTPETEALLVETPPADFREVSSDEFYAIYTPAVYGEDATFGQDQGTDEAPVEEPEGGAGD